MPLPVSLTFNMVAVGRLSITALLMNISHLCFLYQLIVSALKCAAFHLMWAKVNAVNSTPTEVFISQYCYTTAAQVHINNTSCVISTLFACQSWPNGSNHGALICEALLNLL